MASTTAATTTTEVTNGSSPTETVVGITEAIKSLGIDVTAKVTEVIKLYCLQKYPDDEQEAKRTKLQKSMLKTFASIDFAKEVTTTEGKSKASKGGDKKKTITKLNKDYTADVKIIETFEKQAIYEVLKDTYPEDAKELEEISGNKKNLVNFLKTKLKQLLPKKGKPILEKLKEQIEEVNDMVEEKKKSKGKSKAKPKAKAPAKKKKAATESEEDSESSGDE